MTSLPTIKKELEWLHQLIEFRFKKYFNGQESDSLQEILPPELNGDGSPYAMLLKEMQFDTTERIILLMALAVHISPGIYDIFFAKNKNFDRGFTVFGGITNDSHSGFIPTGETASFIVSGGDMLQRFELLKYFSNSHPFHNMNILRLSGVRDGEPVFNGAITISQEYLSLLTEGKKYQPQYTSTFPAKLLNTQLSWEDAVYDAYTLEALDEVRTWIDYGDEIMQNALLQKYLKKGYRILLHGPPGTGKTMTAAILGKESGMSVYQIDLSSVVSKYIGETEKNLAGVFDLAENKNWILFFDEADALFGKRTSIQNSNDQFVNQQVAYLLQRIEDFDGIVILATNFKDNIDTAFLRRFQSVVYFPKPKLEQRLELWEKYFSKTFELIDIDLEEIAREFEITGGNIVNVLRYCSIATKKRNHMKLYTEDIYQGINKEYHKEGVTIASL